MKNTCVLIAGSKEKTQRQRIQKIIKTNHTQTKKQQEKQDNQAKTNQS